MKKMTFLIFFILIACKDNQPISEAINTKGMAPNNVSDLDDYLDRLTPFGFSGAVLVIQNDQVVLNKGYGYANYATKQLNGPETIFPLQSISKTFTATGILKLQMLGKLKLEDPISLFLEVPQDKEKITIAQLLSHSSGIVTGTNHYYAPMDKHGLISKVLSEPLLFSPGTDIAYSNIGYSLLAAIIEETSGLSYEAFLDTYIFEILGMQSTGHANLIETKRNFATQYKDDFSNSSPIHKEEGDWNFVGSGNLMTSTSDLYKWAMAIKNNDILSKELSQQMFSSTNRYDRMGWFIGDSDYGKLIEHDGGSSKGSAANFRWYPDKNTFVIIFSNNNGEGMLFGNNLVDKIDQILFNGPDNAKFPPELAEAPDDFRDVFKTYYFSTTDSLTIQAKEKQYSLQVYGNSAINSLLGNEDFESMNDLNSKAIEAMNFVIANDSINYKKNLNNSSKATFFGYIRQMIQSDNQFGQFKKFEIEATIKDWMIPDGYGMSFVKLIFDEGEKRFRLHWTAEGILALGGSGIPTPSEIDMFPQSENTMVGFHLASEQTIVLTYKQNANGVSSVVLNGQEAFEKHK